jgi:hypothetical protein
MDDLGHPKLPQGHSNLIPFCHIWGNDVTKSIVKEKFINISFLNMWSFGEWGCARINLRQNVWSICSLLGKHP